MTAFLCKEILYQNLFKSNHDDSSINTILRKHDYQLKDCGSAFNSLEDLVNGNQDAFGTDFSSLCHILGNFSSVSASETAFQASTKRIQSHLLECANKIAQIKKETGFASIRLFLLGVAEIQKLKIKLFSLENGVLTSQIFGKKATQKICLFVEANSVRLIEAADATNSCPLAFLSFAKGLSIDSEASFSELAESMSNLKKETSTDRETAVDQISIHQNIKQVHEELFGDDMFDNFSCSDNDNCENALNSSQISFQSENLRTRKERSQELNVKLNQSSFNLSLQEINKPLCNEALQSTILASLASDSQKVSKSNGNKKFQSKVIYEEKNMKDGRIKFYSEESDFGFIITNEGEQFFVHGDDLAKDGIDTKKLAYYARLFDIQLQFRFIQYQGKSKVNRKAVDVKIVGLAPLA